MRTLGRLARRTTVTLATAVAFTITSAALPGVGQANALPGLAIGLASDYMLAGNSFASNERWLGRAVHEHVGVVRIGALWFQIAPDPRPRGFNPSDPASPGYQWGPIDAQVRAMAAHGLRILLSFNGAPVWAQGPGRPSTANGTWRPDPTQFGEFAHAAALRYSGHYPDPENPHHFLPRVIDWQAWNEPNIGYFLNPQYVRSGSGWTAASPGIYRGLLNAFYAAVKGVDKSNFVVAAGTAPYGDSGPRGTDIYRWRIRPIRFYEDLFCLNAKLQHSGCTAPVYLDAVDNHPYTWGAPTQPPYSPDDVNLTDVWRIARVVRAGQRTGDVLPAGHKQVWATEITWDSTPPSHQADAVPVAKQARYLVQAFYELWRQHVSTVLWDAIRDIPQVSSDPNLVFNWGGLYYASGAQKPAATAFRFPFLTKRLDSAHLRAWGRAPARGTLLVQRLLGSGRWQVLARRQVGADQVFQMTLGVTGAARLRARVGNSTSLTWKQTA